MLKLLLDGGVYPATYGTVTFALPACAGLRQTLLLLAVAGVGSTVEVHVVRGYSQSAFTGTSSE